MKQLSPEERRTLLRELALLEYRAAEQGPAPLRQTFLPQGSHFDALLPMRLLVLGDRGTGKSALFRLLAEAPTSAALRLLFDNPALGDTIYIAGFTEEGMAHPPATILEDFALRVSGTAAVRAVWMAHLLRQLASQGVVEYDDQNRWLLDDGHSPFAWMERAPHRVVQLQSALDDAERALVAQGRSVCVLYDQLDRIGAQHAEVQRRTIGALLSLWLSLSQRYRALRGKIFLRDDVLEQTEVDFPDVSKLRRSQSVTLRWSDSDLFRVALRHMVALGPQHLGPWLREAPVVAALLREVPGFGLIPGPMTEELQREFMRCLAGGVVGSGMFQVYTYRWLLSAIIDGRRMGAPRAILSALGGAARWALEQGPQAVADRLLTAVELREGVRQAGLDRLRELREAHPVVKRAENLAGREAPVKPRVMDHWLSSVMPGEAKELSELSGAEVRKKLLRLGVLSQYDVDARCDLPDLYLYALEMKRVAGEGREQERAILKRDASMLQSKGLEATRRARQMANDERAAATGAERPPRREPVQQAFQEAAGNLEEALEISSYKTPVLYTLARLYQEWVQWLPAREATARLQHALDLLEPLYATSIESPDAIGVLRESLAFRSEGDAWDDLERAAEHYRRATERYEELVSPQLHLIRNRLSRLWCRPQQSELLTEAEASFAAVEQSEESQLGKFRPWLLRVKGGLQEVRAQWGGQGPETLTEAMDTYRQAIKAAPYNHYSVSQAGHCLLQKALWDPVDERMATLVVAEETFKQAKLLDGQDPVALAGLEMVTIRRTGWGGAPVAALSDVQERLERLEGDQPSFTCYPLACLHALRGDQERRQHYLDRCRQLARLPPPTWLAREPGF